MLEKDFIYNHKKKRRAFNRDSYINLYLFDSFRIGD